MYPIFKSTNKIHAKDTQHDLYYSYTVVYI